MMEFEREILLAIASLEEGEVVSYGCVAARAGRPKASRAVGRFLSKSLVDLPWWRVVRSDGNLHDKHRARQTELLRAEGVEVEAGRIKSSPRGKFSQQ